MAAATPSRQSGQCLVIRRMVHQLVPRHRCLLGQQIQAAGLAVRAGGPLAFTQGGRQAVQRAGYRTACTTRTGWALRDGDPYRLRRLTVFNTDTASTLARKLYLGSHDVRWSDLARYATRRLRGS